VEAAPARRPRCGERFATDEIRERAREVIARALAGDESVTKPMLDAARSLFAYRPEAAQSERAEAERQHPGAGVHSVRDLVALMADLGVLEQLTDVSAGEAREVARILGGAKFVEPYPGAANGGEAA
jgi:hypothetical protein